MRALIVIDVQNDFVSPKGSLYVKESEEIVNPILDLVRAEVEQDFHRIVLVRDWHTKLHTSFAKSHDLPDYSQYEYKSPKPGDKSTQIGTLWPVHCVQNTWGSQLANPLLKETYQRHLKIVDKGFLTNREYYSAFNDIWNFHKTELHDYLQKHHITEVLIVGVALDYCVKETAISAAKLGYKTAIVRSLTKPINSDTEHLANLEKELAEHNIKLVDDVPPHEQLNTA